MTTFDKREKSFEDKFALDAELEFKIRARRNKLIGLWVAGQLKLDEAAATEYALSVIDEDNKLAGDDDVIAKLVNDLTTAEIETTQDQIETQLLAFEKEARKQLLG